MPSIKHTQTVLIGNWRFNHVAQLDNNQTRHFTKTLPPAITGVVTTGGGATGPFTIDCEMGHGLLVGDFVDVYWDGGCRGGGEITSVYFQTLTIEFDETDPVAFGSTDGPSDALAVVLGRRVALTLGPIVGTGVSTVLCASDARATFTARLNTIGGEPDGLGFVNYFPGITGGIATYHPGAAVAGAGAAVQYTGDVSPYRIGNLDLSTFDFIEIYVSTANETRPTTIAFAMLANGSGPVEAVTQTSEFAITTTDGTTITTTDGTTLEVTH